MPEPPVLSDHGADSDTILDFDCNDMLKCTILHHKSGQEPYKVESIRDVSTTTTTFRRADDSTLLATVIRHGLKSDSITFARP